MKKTILMLLILLTGLQISFAQNSEGRVIYEQKINLHRRLQDESMKAVVPEFRTLKLQLLFKGGVSLYKNFSDNADESITTQSDGGTVRMNFRTPETEVFRDFDAQKLTELRELAGKKFLIVDSLKRNAWKLNPAETRKIKGYDCIQAVTTIKVPGTGMVISNGSGNRQAPAPAPQEQKVVAWFTDAIPSPAGPGNFGGLPGLVLEVDINDGETIISPAAVELKAVTDKELKLPSGGKKVTEKEFNKVRDDYMKEISSQGGGIRIIRN